MRRTRKWAFVAQEAARLAALNLSPPEIAARLGVNRSTVTRWIADGKLTRSKPRVNTTKLVLQPKQTPAEWAAAVRKEYALDATDDQILMLAEAALGLSLDARVAPHVRMNASGRFQSLVRQLALVTRGAEVPEQPSAPAPIIEPKKSHRRIRRPSGDPRAFLTAVK